MRQLKRAYNGEKTPTLNKVLEFSAVTAANLASVGEADAPQVRHTEKNRFLRAGEAVFLRAFCFLQESKRASPTKLS